MLSLPVPGRGGENRYVTHWPQYILSSYPLTLNPHTLLILILSLSFPRDMSHTIVSIPIPCILFIPPQMLSNSHSPLSCTYPHNSDLIPRGAGREWWEWLRDMFAATSHRGKVGGFCRWRVASGVWKKSYKLYKNMCFSWDKFVICGIFEHVNWLKDFLGFRKIGNLISDIPM